MRDEGEGEDPARSTKYRLAESQQHFSCAAGKSAKSCKDSTSFCWFASTFIKHHTFMLLILVKTCQLLGQLKKPKKLQDLCELTDVGRTSTRNCTSSRLSCGACSVQLSDVQHACGLTAIKAVPFFLTFSSNFSSVKLPQMVAANPAIRVLIRHLRPTPTLHLDVESLLRAGLLFETPA